MNPNARLEGESFEDYRKRRSFMSNYKWPQRLVAPVDPVFKLKPLVMAVLSTLQYYR